MSMKEIEKIKKEIEDIVDDYDKDILQEVRDSALMVLDFSRNKNCC